MRLGNALVLAMLVFVVPATASDPAHEELVQPGPLQEAALGETILGRVHALRSPLLIRPSFPSPGGSFEAEIQLPPGAAPATFWLQRGAVRCDLAATSAGAGRSMAWADQPLLQVVRLRVDVPTTCPPALYDLAIEYRRHFGLAVQTVGDVQPRAVRVMDPARHAALASGAAEPRIVVLADPQIGDPRAVVQAGQEDPSRLPGVLDGTLGDGDTSRDGRWRAVREALAEARASDPDFVLVAGDLGFGQLVPGSYAAEYEEIWTILRQADVPLFAAPGNHDGYVSNGQDGFAYWRAYLGPTYTLAPSVPGTYVLVLNTYDWSTLDRLGFSYAVSAWGGQVREAQLAWAQQSLASLRASAPNARILSVLHHSPSWRQDPFEVASQGVPVAEQVERGAVTFTSTDQGWSGRNRLEVRDLLRAFRVEVVFAGHTHHDRVARDDGAGGIVGTAQTLAAMPHGFDPRALHRWTREDALVAGHTQEELAALLRLPSGPLYLDTTTPMSDTDQYWGYRPVAFSYDAEGRLDLAQVGYAMTQAELDELAAHPERYNVAHAGLGLFSKPLRLTPTLPWSELG